MQPETIPDALFFCLQFFIPVLFVIRFFNIPLINLQFRPLVIATNTVILMAALFTFVVACIEIVLGCLQDQNFEQFPLLDRYLGPFSMFAWLTLLSQIVLPQMIWARDLRRSIATAAAWLAATWTFKVVNMLLLQYAVNDSQATWVIFNVDKTAVTYLTQIIIFLVILAPTYIVVSKRYKHKHKHHHGHSHSSHQHFTELS